MTTTPLHDTFREAMATVPQPVTVVTTLEAGEPRGTTVGAFASLSLDPPMVLISLDRESTLLASIRRTRRFGINVLGTDHADLARRFAVRGGDKFFDVGWYLDDDLPRLGGVAGWVGCDVADLVEGGDHLVVLGAVRAADTAPFAALTYHRRSFGTHAPIVAPAGARP